MNRTYVHLMFKHINTLAKISQDNGTSIVVLNYINALYQFDFDLANGILVNVNNIYNLAPFNIDMLPLVYVDFTERAQGIIPKLWCLSHRRALEIIDGAKWQVRGSKTPRTAIQRAVCDFSRDCVRAIEAT